MKYKKHIVFFLFINLIIVFLSIFIGNLTRKLELTNRIIEQDIQKYKDQLKINKIEYSFHNNPDYLKKLHAIYFSFEEERIEKKIVSLSKISNIKDDSIILINLKSNKMSQKAIFLFDSDSLKNFHKRIFFSIFVFIFIFGSAFYRISYNFGI